MALSRDGCERRQLWPHTSLVSWNTYSAWVLVCLPTPRPGDTLGARTDAKGMSLPISGMTEDVGHTPARPGAKPGEVSKAGTFCDSQEGKRD